MSEEFVIALIMAEFFPWQIPEAASLTQNKGQATLAELPQNALDALVERWLKDVYAAAGKQCFFKRVTTR